jgi:hypothetical protein
MKYLFCLAAAVCLCANSAVSASITLNWNASASSGIAGYNVYFGTNSGNYVNKLDAGNSMAATVCDLIPGVTYYFTATAYDELGNESPFCSEVSFLIPGILKMAGSTIAGVLPSIQFPVVPGKWYEVQASSDLQHWTTVLTTAVEAANVWLPFTDVGAGSFPRRFYRTVAH